jgi:hypothetical protein
MASQEQPPKEKGRKRRALFGVAALSLGTLFTLGSAEVVLRVVLPFRYFNWTSAAYPADEFHPRYGWSGIPHLDKPFTLLEFRIRVQNNADGYRDAPFGETLAASDGKERVMFLGDSFGWGWGVEVPERISERFADLDEKRVTFNLCQSGYATDQQLLVLRDQGPKLKPDVVVVLLHPNDFQSVLLSVEDTQQRPKFVLENGALRLSNVPVPQDPEWWAAKRRLGELDKQADDSPNWLTVSHLFNWLRFFYESAPRKSKPKQGFSFDERWAKSAELMEALLAAMKSETDTLGARLVVALIPYQAKATEWQGGVSAACKRQGIDVVDLKPALASRWGAIYRLDPHWTARGHSLAADALHEALRK